MSIQKIDLKTSIVRLDAELTRRAESPLMKAYQEASKAGAENILLDFGSLHYLNSGGIALLVMLICQARKNRQHLLGFGLSPHHREILQLTRLDRLLHIYRNEGEAIAAVGAQELGDGRGLRNALTASLSMEN